MERQADVVTALVSKTSDRASDLRVQLSLSPLHIHMEGVRLDEDREC